MIQSRIICNRCGKEFDTWDKQEDFSIHKRCGYGTKYDGMSIELDLCCECMEWLIKECAVFPVSEQVK